MSWRVFLFVLLFPAFVYAQALPPVPQYKLEPIPPGEDNIVPLPKDAKAPFSGQLYSPDTALRWANFLEQYKLQLQLCHSTYGELRQYEKGYWTTVLSIEEKSHREIRIDLQTRLASVEKKNSELEGELRKGPPWYNSLGFGIALGAAGTLVFVGVTAWALGAVK
jgi:hypothetical protein